MTTYSQNQVSAISRLFSSTVVRELARYGRSPAFARLSREALAGRKEIPRRRVGQFLDSGFEVLKRVDCRHEYIYKAALTHNILLGTHRLHTASMLNEFRVGACKADVAILNGTATVYEIKSERDSLSRLEKQIETYRGFFAKVYVIAGENHIDGIDETVPSDVGILRLSSRNSISKIREAKDRPERTSAITIFESIRTEEAKRILAYLDVEVPDAPNTEMHAALREKFEKLRARKVHEAMVCVLKKTRNLLPLSELVAQLPASLQPAALSVPMRKADHERLIEAVKTPLQTALQWG